MDLLLNFVDRYIATPYIYPSSWQEGWLVRQLLTTWVLLLMFAWILYLSFAALSFQYLFDHSLMKHPKFLKNQVQQEIKYATVSLFWMSFPTLVCVILEIRGYSKLYYAPLEYGLPYLLFSVFWFLLFSDVGIYIIHRAFHEYAWMYKYIHKPHHKWIIATPFASHAFHPIDGFLQSISYHIFVFIFPFNKFLYLSIFIFVNFWTISIHDSTYAVPKLLQSVINGSAHHTDHHTLFVYNYGQYFTFCDKLFGTYLHPTCLSVPEKSTEMRNGKNKIGAHNE